MSEKLLDRKRREKEALDGKGQVEKTSIKTLAAKSGGLIEVRNGPKHR